MIALATYCRSYNFLVSHIDNRHLSSTFNFQLSIDNIIANIFAFVSITPSQRKRHFFVQSLQKQKMRNREQNCFLKKQNQKIFFAHAHRVCYSVILFFYSSILLLFCYSILLFLYYSYIFFLTFLLFFFASFFFSSFLFSSVL